jgi:peptidoglycan biosynthesis protein MviN/MurJ (putative lipid II flippase)
MLLATGVALLAIPLYLALGPRFGAQGLAAAGVIAMSGNAVLTLVYARWLHGAPRLVTLANTALRALVIAAAAALAAGLTIETWMMGATSLLQLVVGGLAFGITALLGARLIGDPPIREAVTRIALLHRRWGRSRG